MANATNTEAIMRVVRALKEYSADTKQTMKQMQDAAYDCYENMEEDDVSKKNMERMSECLNGLQKATTRADEIAQKLANKAKTVESVAK